MATTDAQDRIPAPLERGPERDRRTRPRCPGSRPPVAKPSRHDQEIETPDMIDAAPATTDAHDGRRRRPPTVDRPTRPPSPSAGATGTVPSHDRGSRGRKPNKFMADLTKAMQARGRDRPRGHPRPLQRRGQGPHRGASTPASATEADRAAQAGRRRHRRASASGRRPRSPGSARRPTSASRTARPRLEREIEEHAADIEARIERVQARVDAFEAEMADVLRAPARRGGPDPLRRHGREPARAAAFDDRSPERDPPGPTAASRRRPPSDAGRRAVAEPPPRPTPSRPMHPRPPPSRSADAVEASADAAAGRGRRRGRCRATGLEPPADDRRHAEADLFSIGRRRRRRATHDPRLGALGLTPDFAAAEAEAAAFDRDEQPGSDEEIPVIADDALAARLAGLVPDAARRPRDRRRHDPRRRDRPGQRRQHRRLQAPPRPRRRRPVGRRVVRPRRRVRLRGHPRPDVALRDAVATLPGFGARVTAESRRRA